tara:strand:- start:21186 stop:21773 length:588 start_codon:yes stop_codon:yes gene_type:complete
MASDDFEDIRRVLAICFRSGQPMDSLDLERILSFDMEWMSPDEAETAVQALIGKGWLIGEEGALTPAVSLAGATSPLGWSPRPSRLLHPVAPSTDVDKNEPYSENKSLPLPNQHPSTVASSKIKVSNPLDPRGKLTQRLAKFIAKAAQIPIEEVERRAVRKQQALGFATAWMGLALVAREQDLEMSDIAAALSPR